MDFTNTTSSIIAPPMPLEDEGTTALGVTLDVISTPPTQAVKANQPTGPSANSLPDSILSSWSRIANANMSVRMYNDLVRVATRPAGWRGPGSLALRPASLRNFLDFWSIVRSSAKEPELALAPDGTLHAEWFKSDRRRLDARFLDQKVVFGLFSGNGVLEGAEPRDTVAAILATHRSAPLRWGR